VAVALLSKAERVGLLNTNDEKFFYFPIRLHVVF
jgi:hypothetical protein